MPFCLASAGHRLERQVALGDADRLALEVGKRADAAALARDDGIGRLVEQHEHRLDRRRVGLVAEADQFVDVDERELARAGGDARDRLGRAVGEIGPHREPFGGEQAAVLDATMKGAMLASSGRSKVSWTASGGLASLGAADRRVQAHECREAESRASKPAIDAFVFIGCRRRYETGQPHPECRLMTRNGAPAQPL